MKRFKLAWLIFVVLGSLAEEVAWARGGYYGGGHYGGGHYGGYYGGHFYGHQRFYGGPAFGFYFGPGIGWPYYPYYPYYAYPPAVVTVPSSPPVYIQRDLGQPEPESQSSYWYYCPQLNGYYPYVKDCPGGWQQVSPQPPPR